MMINIEMKCDEYGIVEKKNEFRSYHPMKDK